MPGDMSSWAGVHYVLDTKINQIEICQLFNSAIIDAGNYSVEKKGTVRLDVL